MNIPNKNGELLREALGVDYYTDEIKHILTLIEENRLTNKFEYLANLNLFKICSSVNGIHYYSFLYCIKDGWFNHKSTDYAKAIAVLKDNLPLHSDIVPTCPRCNIEMQLGIAINAFDDNVLTIVPIKRIDKPELIACWKCPSCGHSEDLDIAP